MWSWLFGVRRNALFALPPSVLEGGAGTTPLRYEEVDAVRPPEKQAAKVSVGLILVLVVVLLAMAGMATLAYAR